MIFNILSLMIIIFFIYGILGCCLFSELDFSGLVLDEYTGFQNFFKATITLFRMSTGDM